MFLSTLAAIGFFMLFLGFASARHLKRLSRSDHTPPQWKRQRSAARIAGIILGLASLTFQYPYTDSDGKAVRIHGVPFFVGHIDEKGAHPAGLLAIPATIANIAAWYYAPQLILVLFVRRRGKNAPAGEVAGEKRDQA